MRTFALMWHPFPLFAYVRIFIVLTGLFNFCSFNLGSFVLMAKIGSGFFYGRNMDPGSVCRQCKVFCLKSTKPNKFNPKLLLRYSWSLATSQFSLMSFTPCKAEQPLGEMELQEQEKDENQIGNLLKNPVY